MINLYNLLQEWSNVISKGIGLSLIITSIPIFLTIILIGYKKDFEERFIFYSSNIYIGSIPQGFLWGMLTYPYSDKLSPVVSVIILVVLTFSLPIFYSLVSIATFYLRIKN